MYYHRMLHPIMCSKILLMHQLHVRGNQYLMLVHSQTPKWFNNRIDSK